MKLVIGTSNDGKFIELSGALSGLPIEPVRPADIGITDSPEEHGEAYADNARIKAKFYNEKSGLPTLADDSGIVIEALRNELGVHTRRWGAGSDATDGEWIAYFLDRMRMEGNKRARFIGTLCFIDEHGNEHIFEGICDGVITDELEAEYLPGLPISACFKPDGFEKVYSALKVEEKNRISHRGRALLKFIEHIKSFQP